MLCFRGGTTTGSPGSGRDPVDLLRLTSCSLQLYPVLPIPEPCAGFHCVHQVASWPAWNSYFSSLLSFNFQDLNSLPCPLKKGSTLTLMSRCWKATSAPSGLSLWWLSRKLSGPGFWFRHHHQPRACLRCQESHEQRVPGWSPDPRGSCSQGWRPRSALRDHHQDCHELSHLVFLPQTCEKKEKRNNNSNNNKAVFLLALGLLLFCVRPTPPRF
nr:uncharacterized protein LOC102130382 [Macaca fascicularis]